MTNDSTQDEINQLGTQVQALFEEMEGVEQTVLAHEIKLHDMDADYQETDRSIRALNKRFDDLLIRIKAIEEDLRG